ncbi:hypothetical protein OH773_02510 [Buttiauxella sp. WJP83]|uniref:hypothetical protein n=1 Tax=Buttiauxella sp. WJP83 TaxID=2986951 RepID=UPI0022DE29F5|nr:hypothetical protein [Buttiauxella sp. WJP83]WBM71160.1 hypothetical protein OH773_02510 [Buttiauxella sp. WJP83]
MICIKDVCDFIDSGQSNLSGAGRMGMSKNAEEFFRRNTRQLASHNSTMKDFDEVCLKEQTSPGTDYCNQ